MSHAITVASHARRSPASPPPSLETRPSRLESEALRRLARLAYAATHERGDIYVARTSDPRTGRVRLESWAREIDPELAEMRLPPGLRADAEAAALELDGWLEVAPDPAGRKIVFRIDAPRPR